MRSSNRLSFLCLLFSIVCSTTGSLSAQDSLSKKIEFDISLLNRYQLPLGAYPANEPGYGVKIHPVLAEYRSAIFDPTHYNPILVQNNPVFHNTLQATLHSRWRIAREISLFADLLVEQQGHSYGVFNAERTFVFPMVRMDAARDFHLGQQQFSLYGSLGTFRNFRLNEGLFLYGLDLQGLDLNLRWKRLRLRYVQINDMRVWIGLGMNEPVIINLAADSLPITKQWKADLRGSFTVAGYLNGPGFSTAIYRKNLRLYAEAGLNLDKFAGFASYVPNEGWTDQLGLVAGLSWQKEAKKWRLGINANYRYYGNSYLHGMKSTYIGYKGGGVNYLGGTERQRRSFAPVHYLDRPFAQLALFSDFQSFNFRDNEFFLPDVSALSLVGEFRYRIPWDLFLEAYVDLNLLFVEGAEPFSYPFYRIGLGWEPAPGNAISLFVTNKGFDIEQHYPTHQLFQNPFLALSATRDLPSWQPKMWR